MTNSGGSTIGRHSARTGPLRPALWRPSPAPSATMPHGSASRTSSSTPIRSPRPTATRWEARRPPEPKAELDFEERLEGVALASRCRTRKVALKGRWWREEHGPILGRIEETKEPVALLQVASNAYDQVDPRTGSRTRVTAEVAEALDPFGWVLYRRFKDGVLTARDIAVFGARGLKRDLVSLVAMLLWRILDDPTPNRLAGVGGFAVLCLLIDIVRRCVK